MKKTGKNPVILIFPFDLLSHYLRSIQLAQSIKDNFDIRFCSSRKYNDIILKAGFKIFNCESFDPDKVLKDSRKFKFTWLNYENLKRVFQSQVKTIQKYNPKIIIGDTAPTLKMAAEYTKTRHISLMNGYMSKYYALTRNISKDHPAAILMNELPQKLIDKMTQTGEQVAFHLIQKAFNRLRKEYNLPKQKMYLDELEGDYNIICDDPEMFPQKKLPKNYRIIGPLYYESSQKEPEIRKILSNGKPGILVNIGSSGELKRFSFLKDDYFKDFKIVVTGEIGDELKSSNVIKRKFINSGAILDKIDLVLCHGGNGTIYQSLAHGVPVICATSIFEQEWNAKRVEDLRYGKCIDDIDSKSEIIKIIDEWISKKHSDKFKLLNDRLDVNNSIYNFRKFIREKFIIN